MCGNLIVVRSIDLASAQIGKSTPGSIYWSSGEVPRTPALNHVGPGGVSQKPISQAKVSRPMGPGFLVLAMCWWAAERPAPYMIPRPVRFDAGLPHSLPIWRLPLPNLSSGAPFLGHRSFLRACFVKALPFGVDVVPYISIQLT